VKTITVLKEGLLCPKRRDKVPSIIERFTRGFRIIMGQHFTTARMSKSNYDKVLIETSFIFNAQYNILCYHRIEVLPEFDFGYLL